MKMQLPILLILLTFLVSCLHDDYRSSRFTKTKNDNFVRANENDYVSKKEFEEAIKDVPDEKILEILCYEMNNV